MKTHVILICSLLLFGCAQTRKFQNPESLSMDVKFLEDTTKMAKYERMFDEDAKIMSQWTEEEKQYFYEHFVFSFEELEEELGLKLPPEEHK